MLMLIKYVVFVACVMFYRTCGVERMDTLDAEASAGALPSESSTHLFPSFTSLAWSSGGLPSACTATCNGKPAPLYLVGRGQHGGKGGFSTHGAYFECWGRYETTCPPEEVNECDGAVQNCLFTSGQARVTGQARCEGHTKIATSTRNTWWETLTHLASNLSLQASNKVVYSCKGNFQSFVSSADMVVKSTATAAAVVEEDAEHIALMNTLTCSAALKVYSDGEESCWANEAALPWSAGSSEAILFRIFPASATPSDVDACVHTQWLWLQENDVLPAPGRDQKEGNSSDTHFSATTEMDVSCEYTCDGKTVHAGDSCPYYLKSECSVAATSARYDVDVNLRSMCEGSAHLEEQGGHQTCEGSILLDGDALFHDKAAGAKPIDFDLPDTGYTGFNSIVPMKQDGWVGVKVMST